MTDTDACCDHNYIRARGPPGGCNEDPGLGLLSSLVLTRWDPRSAIIYGELPRPEEAVILTYEGNPFIEASATSEKSIMPKGLSYVDGEMINSPAIIHEDNDIGTQ